VDRYLDPGRDGWLHGPPRGGKGEKQGVRKEDEGIKDPDINIFGKLKKQLNVTKVKKVCFLHILQNLD
jgi:hypothetical protein